jgi:thioredoxin-related protein
VGRASLASNLTMKFNNRDNYSERYYVLRVDRHELALCDRFHRNFTQENAFRTYTAFDPTSCIISNK